jgi:hypothetical protein
MAAPTVSKRLPIPVFLTGDASVNSLTLASGVTANSTSTAVAGVPGVKTFWGEVAGTGAVTATAAVYGARTSTAVNGVLLATITLSGTTQAQDVATTSTANYPYYYVVTTNVTGTGATVHVEVFY